MGVRSQQKNLVSYVTYHESSQDGLEWTPCFVESLLSRRETDMKTLRLASIIVIVFFLSLMGCSSMTPRYRLSGDLPVPDERQAALLQIPPSIHFGSFDSEDTTFAVSSSLSSTAIVNHPFRETLVPAGVHTITYWTFDTQDKMFFTTMEFKKGHTYRIQSKYIILNRTATEIEYKVYGWIEALPFMLEPRKISIGFNFDQQCQYWYDQDWRIVAGGILCDKKNERNSWPEQDSFLCQEAIKEIRIKFPNIK